MKVELRANPGSPCFAAMPIKPVEKRFVVLRAIEPKAIGLAYHVIARGGVIDEQNKKARGE